MNQQFFQIFNLTETQAIKIIKTPLAELESKTDRYIAIAHLVNFPTEKSLQTLLEILADEQPDMYHRISRRKAIEVLGIWQNPIALPAISQCLADPDVYTVENAVWAIGEIGINDPNICAQITKLLDQPHQSYRVIMQTLAKFNYQPAVLPIQKFVNAQDELIKSAAIASICRLTKDYSQINLIVNLLQSPLVNARRACIQDLMDTEYFEAIPKIARCPVSPTFRLRGIKLLAEAGIRQGKINFSDIEPELNLVILDHPDTLNLVDRYDHLPTLENLIKELYQSDFGKSYLATKTLLKFSPDSVGPALMQELSAEAANDYGANYHIIKLLGWLKYAPAYDVLIKALHNPAPQMQKSRRAAAISLANLGERSAIPEIKKGLTTPFWELQYATLLALEKLGEKSVFIKV